jgi:hypothetical protein
VKRRGRSAAKNAGDEVRVEASSVNVPRDAAVVREEVTAEGTVGTPATTAAEVAAIPVTTAEEAAVEVGGADAIMKARATKTGIPAVAAAAAEGEEVVAEAATPGTKGTTGITMMAATSDEVAAATVAAEVVAVVAVAHVPTVVVVVVEGVTIKRFTHSLTLSTCNLPMPFASKDSFSLALSS